MYFEMFVNQNFLSGIMARTQVNPDGTKIVQLLSRRSGLWIPVSQQQLSEGDIPSDCIFMTQDLASDETKVKEECDDKKSA